MINKLVFILGLRSNFLTFFINFLSFSWVLMLESFIHWSQISPTHKINDLGDQAQAQTQP